MLTDKQQHNMTLLIKALISGDYQQGRKRLYNSATNQHDVLGVALTLFRFPHLNGEFFFGSNADKRSGRSSKYAVPVTWFKKTFGIDPTMLVYYSDDHGWSFNQLACHLLSYLPKNPSTSQLQIKIYELLRRDVQRQVKWVAGLAHAAT